MTNYEKICAMSVEEMAVLINDAEERLQTASCSKEHCEVWREDGHCKSAFKDPCIRAIAHWLNSEAEEEAEQNGLTDGQKDALLRTFLGRGGSGA